MPEPDADSAAATRQYVDIDIYAGDDRVERLRMDPGEDFGTEVHCDDYRLEVVEVGTYGE